MWVGADSVSGVGPLAAFIYDFTYCKYGEPKVREIRQRLLGLERYDGFRVALFKGFKDRELPNVYRF